MSCGAKHINLRLDVCLFLVVSDIQYPIDHKLIHVWKTKNFYKGMHDLDLFSSLATQLKLLGFFKNKIKKVHITPPPPPPPPQKKKKKQLKLLERVVQKPHPSSTPRTNGPSSKL
jgi:hypothetical protein